MNQTSADTIVSLLEIRDLSVEFQTEEGTVHAVEEVSLTINPREIVAIVGESGSGKTVSQLSVLQLVPTPPGRIVSGQAIFEGIDLLSLPPKGTAMREIRGGKIGIVFQEPMTSLNPVLTVGRQITETLELHRGLSREAARQRAIELMQSVGLDQAYERFESYPHEFSGGMRQRIMIAIAIACEPRLIVADEPTTALDVTTQAQVLDLLRDLVIRIGASLVIVTHNLGVVARYADRIYVMYAGRVVEHGPARAIFRHPLHPYTVGLLACVPRIDRSPERRLRAISGVLPDTMVRARRCPFLPRCERALDACSIAAPPDLETIAEGRAVACYAVEP